MRSHMLNKALLASLAILVASCGQGGAPAQDQQRNPHLPSSAVKDLAPPSIELVTTTETITEVGDLTLTAKAADTSGIAKVEFYQGNMKIAEATSAPYQATVTFADRSQNGSYTFMVRAIDTVGNVASSQNVTVKVAIPASTPPAADTVAPSVTLSVNPPEIQEPGTVTVAAQATDNVGVTKVEFYRDGELVATDREAPFVFQQDFRSWRDNDRFGYVTYHAVAFDEAKNTTESNHEMLLTSIPIPPPVIPLDIIDGSWNYTLTRNDGTAPVHGRVKWTGMIKAGPPSSSFVGDHFTCENPQDARSCRLVGPAFLTVNTETATLELNQGDEVFYTGVDADSQVETRDGLPVLAGSGQLGTGQAAAFEFRKLP